MTKIIQLPRIDTQEEINWVPPVGCTIVRTLTPEGEVLNDRVSKFKGVDVNILDEHDGNRNLAIAWLVEHAWDCHIGGVVREWLGDEEWIYAAAGKAASGEVFYATAPCRHHHVMRGLNASMAYAGKQIGVVQGFLVFREGEHRFVGRSEAMVIAGKNGQLWRVPGGYDGKHLFSEDLW